MKAALFAKVDEIAAGVTSRMQFNWSMHSPSKVAYKLGAYYVEGLINGFADMTEPAIETAESMALSVVDAVSAAMDTSTQVLEDTYSVHFLALMLQEKECKIKMVVRIRLKLL